MYETKWNKFRIHRFIGPIASGTRVGMYFQLPSVLARQRNESLLTESEAISGHHSEVESYSVLLPSGKKIPEGYSEVVSSR